MFQIDQRTVIYLGNTFEPPPNKTIYNTIDQTELKYLVCDHLGQQVGKVESDSGTG